MTESYKPYLYQHQIWHDFSRDILMNEHSSVQIEIGAHWVDRCFHCKAYICALYTNPQSRKQGHASQILAAAEQLCRDYGHDKVLLGYHEKDTPIEILEWYKRCGYVEANRDISGKIYLSKKLK
jgi:GNAT superfamily N-acetyltransferase